MKLSGWGRYPKHETDLQMPRSVEALAKLVTEKDRLIARGNGRSYGDSAVNKTCTIDMRRLNRMLDFDAASGVLTAEAGVMLEDIIAAFLPKGWFPSITPGTKFVTLGGAIAADVHGKNHHKDGSFRTCIKWIDVMSQNGETIRCSRDENETLFDHTLGGMGLTGIILRASIQLRPVETAWIRQTTQPAPNLRAAMDAFEDAIDATYSVAWIDCLSKGDQLGRSLVIHAEHAKLSELSSSQAAYPLKSKKKTKVSVPIDFPGFALNGWTVRAFNHLYYLKGKAKPLTRIVDWDSYFYPLDAILKWNRIYGRKGFIQYQCAIPLENAEAGLTQLLETIAQANSGSFLAVLKRLGKADGAFSFPLEGYTLALDFPATSKTLRLLQELDEITIAHGGRYYLAKDSRVSAQTLQDADPRVAAFVKKRQEQGWSDRFASAQSERLSL